MWDLIVVGGGPGGYEAAAHAGRMGKKVALVEKDGVGGVCLHVGCIPTKTFLKSAHVLAQCRGAAVYGVGCEALDLDFGVLQARKKKVVELLKRGIEGTLKRAGVELIRGEAILTGPGVVTVAGQEQRATNILIATGSEPARPPIPGLDGEAVLNSTSILDLAARPESLVIIGGGFIGLEFATFFAEVGTRVTVIEMLPAIASGVDAEIAALLLRALKKKGITFQLGARVNGIEGSDVHFVDEKGQAQSASGVLVLNATGRTPVVRGLGLETMGVEVGRQGIVVSDEGRTNVSGVWACGDVTGRMLLAHAAAREGVVAVNNMFGRRDRIRYDAVPGVIYTHPEVAVVGRTEQQLQKDGVKYRKGLTPMGVSGRFIVENEGQSGAIKVLADTRYGEILGVHMIGEGCGEMIFGAAMMIEMEACVEDLERTVFPHPTVSEALREAIVRGLDIQQG